MLAGTIVRNRSKSRFNQDCALANKNSGQDSPVLQGLSFDHPQFPRIVTFLFGQLMGASVVVERRYMIRIAYGCHDLRTASYPNACCNTISSSWYNHRQSERVRQPETWIRTDCTTDLRQSSACILSVAQGAASVPAPHMSRAALLCSLASAYSHRQISGVTRYIIVSLEPQFAAVPKF